MRHGLGTIGYSTLWLVACGAEGGGDSPGTSSDTGESVGMTVGSAATTAATTTATSSPTGDPTTTTADDSSTATSSVDATAADTSSGPGECVAATLLWSEDFETLDYSRWTSMTYDAGWNGGLCHDNEFSDQESVSPGHSHRSEITCASDMSVHRGYGGLQFDGDAVVPAYTNVGEGIEAPGGIVNTFWSRLDAPYAFADGRWFSFWTVNDSCDYSSDVLTLGLENTQNLLVPAHVLSTGGTVEFDPAAPAFPMGEFVRITIYVNYYDGVMHVWQNGASVVHATFTRPGTDLCQWHWGAYASGDNDDLVLWEDDNSLWRLDQPWDDFTVEPWLGETIAACG